MNGIGFSKTLGELRLPSGDSFLETSHDIIHDRLEQVHQPPKISFKSPRTCELHI